MTLGSRSDTGFPSSPTFEKTNSGTSSTTPVESQVKLPVGKISEERTAPLSAIEMGKVDPTGSFESGRRAGPVADVAAMLMSPGDSGANSEPFGCISKLSRNSAAALKYLSGGVSEGTTVYVSSQNGL